MESFEYIEVIYQVVLSDSFAPLISNHSSKMQVKVGYETVLHNFYDSVSEEYVTIGVRVQEDKSVQSFYKIMEGS